MFSLHYNIVVVSSIAVDRGRVGAVTWRRCRGCSGGVWWASRCCWGWSRSQRACGGGYLTSLPRVFRWGMMGITLLLRVKQRSEGVWGWLPDVVAEGVQVGYDRHHAVAEGEAEVRGRVGAVTWHRCRGCSGGVWWASRCCWGWSRGGRGTRPSRCHSWRGDGSAACGAAPSAGSSRRTWRHVITVITVITVAITVITLIMAITVIMIITRSEPGLKNFPIYHLLIFTHQIFF